MRNQIAAAERLGVRAHTINSTNRDERDHVRRLLAHALTKRDAEQVAAFLTANVFPPSPTAASSTARSGSPPRSACCE